MKPTYLDPTNPIVQAVLPLKAEARTRAEQDARKLADRYLAKLAENGNDLNRAYPYPNSMKDSRNSYLAKKRDRTIATLLTMQDPADKSYSYRMNDPQLRVASPDAIAKFCRDAMEQASLQYDAFVAKLIGKIGECKTAAIAGSHVWGHSILTITKGDGEVEKWKTQQIVNQSPLGLLFNQWPTRKVK